MSAGRAALVGTMTGTTFASAWEQIGEPVDNVYPVSGIDGGAYLARHEMRRGERVWTIARADECGPGRVTQAHDLKGAVQRLNAFHVRGTCDHCGHVHSEHGHGCESCGRIRYALRYA